MLTSEHQGIHKRILERLIQIHDEIILNDREYRELGEEPGAVRRQIAASLDNRHRELLECYDCLCTEQMGRQDEIIYTEGLMDGVVHVAVLTDKAGGGNMDSFAL